jgi:type III pantothenate kinase
VKLLIDAGNSRIKWGVHDGSAWLAQGAVWHDEIAQLAEMWQRWPVDQVYASSVAREDVRLGVETAVPVRVCWVEAQKDGGGIHNHYHDPRQMGADRWLAVLAAKKLTTRDVIVVCAGTALTIESLTLEGDYLGGLILPGYRTMLDSLAQATARLDQPAGQRVDFPQCTEDALASGAVEGLVGAVERARIRLSDRTLRALPEVIVTGGDASLIGPWLASPAKIVDNLVLLGLLEVANAS